MDDGSRKNGKVLELVNRSWKEWDLASNSRQSEELLTCSGHPHPQSIERTIQFLVIGDEIQSFSIQSNIQYSFQNG
jgi:hypothetical protein